jgi:hypothetical protein
MADLQFADFTWPARWNKGEVVATLSQSGPDVMATGFFGVIRFSLDDAESVAAIVNHARRFADMVERTKRDYDQGQDYLDMLAEEARRSKEAGEDDGFMGPVL